MSTTNTLQRNKIFGALRVKTLSESKLETNKVSKSDQLAAIEALHCDLMLNECTASPEI